ncbi:MAG: cysteine hydrolase [Reyranella sp.]|uniref:cysteine hydrolase family protein n=1 Tax=Reyranella sp. TaxID=1929291 RepID=UPI001AC1F2D0|nr:cysteine hydrolase family protein [Reyranella sp.]MBN9089259.1 cysteine hydrolase [Reyranella sp.]
MTDALIVIDMQQGSFGPDSARHDAAGLVERLNHLARDVRTDGGAVIFVQHDGPPGDPHHPDEPGWRLLPTLELRPDDTVVRKRSCDAFLDTVLDAVLRENGIDRLIITGCATDYCVDTTVRSALARGWPTVVPSDGHTTADRPHLSATQIIAHHNAIWADFLAPKGPARVCLCTEVVLST